jgi:transposase-like protein
MSKAKKQRRIRPNFTPEFKAEVVRMFQERPAANRGASSGYFIRGQVDIPSIL